MIRAMWEEMRRTFSLPATPWEEFWWNDEYLSTGLWVALPLAVATFVGLLFLLHFPKGAGVLLVLASTGIVYGVALFGVAAYLRTRTI